MHANAVATPLLLAALVTACGATPAPPFEPDALATDPGTGLVWVEDAEGRHQTLWVSLDDGRPLASQPIDGPLWAIGPRLWQWIEEPVDVPLYDCTNVADLAEPMGTARVRRVVLRELTESLELELRPLPSLEPSREASHSVRPIASVGPYVFAVEELSADSCGAHGGTEARAILWDLRAGQSARVLWPRERWAMASAEEQTARQRLVAESEGMLDGVEPSDVELAALWPRWDPAGGLELEYVFVMAACNACSDGEWGSYARATRVPAAALPLRLAPHAAVPEWAHVALARIEGGKLLGFTRVEHPAPARILDALRR